jgi:hypothetical protein
MTSATFFRADREVTRIVKQIKEIRGRTGKHWMALWLAVWAQLAILADKPRLALNALSAFARNARQPALHKPKCDGICGNLIQSSARQITPRRREHGKSVKADF